MGDLTRAEDLESEGGCLRGLERIPRDAPEGASPCVCASRTGARLHCVPLRLGLAHVGWAGCRRPPSAVRRRKRVADKTAARVLLRRACHCGAHVTAAQVTVAGGRPTGQDPEGFLRSVPLRVSRARIMILWGSWARLVLSGNLPSHDMLSRDMPSRDVRNGKS